MYTLGGTSKVPVSKFSSRKYYNTKYVVCFHRGTNFFSTYIIYVLEVVLEYYRTTTCIQLQYALDTGTRVRY